MDLDVIAFVLVPLHVAGLQQERGHLLYIHIQMS
jgi:hypothetical protein